MFVNNGKGLLIRFINLDIEKEIEIPENVKIIGKSCFEDEDIIQTVSICKNIRRIEESAFENCKLKQYALVVKHLKKNHRLKI